MATHSSVLAWRIPWTEEPGGLQPMGSQSDATEHACTHLDNLIPPPGEMSHREVKRLAQRHTTSETGPGNLAFVTEENSG